MRDAATVSAMLCPVCKVGLAMSDRQGIEIDYCPQCRGVWLDRGELDKIVERSAPDAVQPFPAPQSSGWTGGERRSGQDPRYEGRRKKSVFEDLFD